MARPAQAEALTPCRARGCTRFASNPAFSGYCRHCWVEACAEADRDRTKLPPWARRNSDCLTGMIVGAFVGYFGGHLLVGREECLWGLLLGALLGALAGWGRSR